VLDVAVVGLPGEAGSERVVAAIVLNAGHELDSEGLRAHAKDGLAAYKVPREFFVIAELPTNALGKVLRREVAAHLREG
jgi:long-chain acyl-CoA synthetase